jgi:predicted transcriptional regulator
MDLQRLQSMIAAVLSTVYEVSPTDPTPKTPIYLAMGTDLGLFMRICQVMQGAGMITQTPETITLTDKGREVGKKCSEILAEAKQTGEVKQ